MTFHKYYKNLVQDIPTFTKLSFGVRYVIEHTLGWFPPLLSIIKKWESKIQKKIYTSVKHHPKTILKIDELDKHYCPSKIKKHYIKKGIPFVIRDGAKNWDAFKHWGFSFFKDNFGNHPVLLSNHDDLGENIESEPRNSNLKNKIDGINNNSLDYARFNPLLDNYPLLQTSLNQKWLNDVRDTKFKKHHVLFIGNKKTKTPIHNTGNENLFVQIRGQKKWLIWHQNAHYIFNPKVNRAPAKSSDINPYNIDKNNNSAFQYLPKCEITLNEGDIIFIPSYLWHYVENKTATIGIGIRWLSVKNSFKNNPLFSFLELLNTSPSIFTTLNWKKGFDFNKIMMLNENK